MKTIGPRKIALVHVARAKTGMTEEEYRALLSGVGVASSRDLDHRQFRAVMDQFAKLGFVSNARSRRPPESKKRLTAKVEAIRAELGLTQSYIDAMAKHMFRVDSWRWLKADQLHKLVAALTYHQRRKAGGA